MSLSNDSDQDFTSSGDGLKSPQTKIDYETMRTLCR